MCPSAVSDRCPDHHARATITRRTRPSQTTPVRGRRSGWVEAGTLGVGWLRVPWSSPPMPRSGPPEHGGLHMHREKQEVAGVGGRPFSPVREARDARSDRGGREDRAADQQWPAGAVSPGAAYARGHDQGTPDDRQERGDADDEGSAGPDPRGRTARPRTFELIAAASDMPARSDRRVGVTGGAVRGSRQRPRLLSLAVASALASAWALRRRSRSSQVPEMSSSQPVTTFKPSARSS
jgi:hypothetical protein